MSDKLNDKQRWNEIILLLLVLGLLAITACSSTGQKGSKPSYRPISWTKSSEDTLMRQVADHEMKRNYSRYLPDELIAVAKVFGIDWEGEQGTAYVDLLTCEVVALKGKAYMMSSSSGEAILRFNYDGQYPKLTDLEWSASGGEHDKWLEDHFPADYLEASKDFRQQEQDGEDEVELQIREKVKELLDAPLEIEDLLEIDQDEASYEIVRIYEGYDDKGEYQFNFETIDKGSLKELPETVK